MKMTFLLPILGLVLGSCIKNPSQDTTFAVLVFHKTTGYRHDSIVDTLQLITRLGHENGFGVEITADASRFTPEILRTYAAVVFAHTTGDVLNDMQQSAFESYIRSGGGFVGIHAAADAEYDWPWYGQLVGAYFKNHPQVQAAILKVEDASHPSTQTLPYPTWTVTDEWYNFRSNPRGQVKVLLTLNENSYQGGEMGSDHPIAWCQEYQEGRSWYTGLGHNRELYSNLDFQQHILGGILYASGVTIFKCS
jgi:type 1 glutamine amidotransferase